MFDSRRPIVSIFFLIFSLSRGRTGGRAPAGHACMLPDAQVMMPNMVSVARDAVFLSLYVAPVSLTSKAREGVPGDFAVEQDTAELTTSGHHFARLSPVTIDNILKLR